MKYQSGDYSCITIKNIGFGGKTLILNKSTPTRMSIDDKFKTKKVLK